MKIWNPFKKEPEAVKESAAGVAISQFVIGQVINTPRDYRNLSKEGYQKNVIAFRCINMIASAVASVPWYLESGEKEIKNHPVLDLLAKPNPGDGMAGFMEKLAAYLLIAGNSYVEASRLSDASPPIELYNLRPDRMTIIGGPKGVPEAYRYTANGSDVDFPVTPSNGRSNCYHMKTFHPIEDWYGLAPLEAGAFAVDQHNAAGNHNASLLQNRAVPSGTLIYKSNPGDAEMKRVQQLMIDRYSSPRNAGKPMILGGDVEWHDMTLTPKEMDFTNSLLSVARDICTAFGVPHVLIVPGQSTYRNMEEARLMLWEDTVIPLLCKIKDGFFNWLLGFYGPGLSMQYDLDGISALIPRRIMHREAVMSEWNAGLITRNEARAALEYEPAKADGDVFFTSGFGSVSADPKAEPDPKKWAALPVHRKDAFLTAMMFTAPEEIDDPTLSANVSAFLEGLFASLTAKYGEEIINEIGERSHFQNSARVQNYVKETTGQLITRVNETTKKRIRDQIAEAFSQNETVAQVRERVESVFKEASATRAQAIAVTESTRVTGFASEVALEQSGVEYKQWLATRDGHTRDAHARMDGQVQPVGTKFEAPDGHTTDYPGGFGIARLDIHCRCAIAAAYPEKSIKAMDERERAELWKVREKQRQPLEKEIVESFVKVFTMQEAAVIKRINAILGGI